MRKNVSGFTIVELLIVIVVIGILATITVVSYRGIQARANESAIKSDLSAMAKQVELHRAEKGVYPSHREFFGHIPTSMSIAPTKSAYDPKLYNFYYCTNSVDQGEDFGIAARPAPGRQTYTISSKSGIETVTTPPSWNSACGALGATDLADVHFSYGYSMHSGTGAWLPPL